VSSVILPAHNDFLTAARVLKQIRRQTLRAIKACHVLGLCCQVRLKALIRKEGGLSSNKADIVIYLYLTRGWVGFY